MKHQSVGSREYQTQEFNGKRENKQTKEMKHKGEPTEPAKSTAPLGLRDPKEALCEDEDVLRQETTFNRRVDEKSMAWNRDLFT